MANGIEIWMLIVVQLVIVIFVLTALGVIAYSLVEIARSLGDIADELRERGQNGPAAR